MKLVVLVCTIMHVIRRLDAAIVLDDDAIQQSWLKFKDEHNRNYEEAEDAERKVIFDRNLKFIIQHNLAYERGEVSYTVGITSRADMSHSDCTSARKRSAVFHDEPRFGDESRFDNTHLNNGSLRYESKRGSCGCIPLPCKTGIDYVAKKRTPSVEDQGQCGCCYAFGALTATTAALAERNNLKNPNWLSVQQGIDCSYHIYPNYAMNNGCDGGYPGYVYEGLKTAGGITSWSQYPYISAYSGRCDTTKPVNARIKTYVPHNFYHLIQPNSTQLPQNVINDIECKLIQELQHGPVTVSVCDDQTFMNFHPTKKNMVYNNRNCANACRLERLNLQPPENLEYPITHTVTIVGYTKDYWLIQNSWGVTWGWKGFMRMERGLGICGVGLQITRPELV